MEFKGKLARTIFKALAVILAASFFAPWVSISQHVDDVLVFSASYSPLQLALGAGFPYDGSFFVVFLLLAMPLALLVLCHLKWPYKRLAVVTSIGLLFVTIFNMVFAFGIDYRAHATSTPFFWLMVGAYAAALAVLFLGAKSQSEVKIIENTIPPYNQQQKLATAAIMLALAVVVAIFSITIPVGGVPALRIGFAGIFNNTTAILFGPMFGGIQRALQDMINHFINPMGAFLWPVTVVAFLRGASTGWLWLRVRNVRPKVYSTVYSVVFVLVFAFGLFNLFMQLFAADSAYITAIAPREGQGLFFSTAYYVSSWGLIAAGLIGLVPQFVVYKLTKKSKKPQFYDRFIKFLVAIMVPGLFFNSVNSLILFFTAVSSAAINRGFVYWWAPRFFEELVTSIIITYIMVMLMEVYEKAMKRKIVQNNGETEEDS